MKRKLLALLLCLAMAAALAGCGSSDTAETAGSDAEAEETGTEEAAEEAGTAEGTTYEGVGEGRNGDIKVGVTIDGDGVITDIEVLESEETDGVGTTAYDEMIPLMVANNTIAVDTVTSATLTSEGLLEAVTNALEAAGLNPDDYQGAVSVAQGEDREYDVDVVIIGAGGAGLAAAASASDAGATVLVLEKTAAVGGNTKLGEGTYNSADPDLLQAAADAGRDGVYMTDNDRAEVEEALEMDTDGNEELEALIADVKADYEEWEASGSEIMFDSVNWHALQTYIGGGNMDNIALIRKYAEEAPNTLEWLEDTIGIPFKDDYIFMAIGGKWTRGHQIDMVAATGAEGDNGGGVYISKLTEYDEANGVEIVCNAQVTSLVVSDDAVIGCEAECSDGSTITVNAGSVILTTGGYGANQELVLKYSDGAITTTLHSCAVSSTGDGLGLAENVGAQLINLDQIQVHPLGDPIGDCGCVAEFVGNWMSATEYMFVNKEGERFINEDATRAEISAAELQQTDGQMWLIVDSSTITDEVMADREAQINSLLADGHSYVADTIEELAEEIGVDPETLQATVDQYNEYMKNGSDEDYGKVASEEYTIEAGPFYASLRTPTVHYTMGGIEINTDTQVIDTDGNAIAGLYAAGEVASGIHGNNRLGGNAYPDIMTFGKLAGEQAAAYALAE